MLKKVLAEFVGVFALVVVAVLAVYNMAPGGLLGIALANGIVIACFVAAYGQVSGAHFNPAVTLAMLAIRRQKAGEALAYLVAQFAAAFAACALLLGMGFGPQALAGGTPQPGADAFGQPLGLVPVLLSEIVSTFFLVTIIFSAAVDKKGAGGTAWLVIGLGVAVNILALGTVSGASMNPARFLGPAVMGGALEMAWVYIVGPIVGALLAAALYEFVLKTKEAA